MIQESNNVFTLAESLRSYAISPGWVKENTSILVVHGIGDQVPLATLDDFARGLVKEYQTILGSKLTLSHELMVKEDNGKVWFDNVIRIKNGTDTNYIDVYEYYWANYTEDKATWADLNKWLQGVIKGAKDFYKKNGALGRDYKDKSPFFDTRTGDFKPGMYKFFIGTVARLFMIFDITYRGLLKLISFIPFLGQLAASLTAQWVDTFVHNLTNVIGDVAIYNVVDPKSKFYCIRSQISDGAIAALRYILEKTSDTDKFKDLQVDLYYKRITKEEYERELKELHIYYPSVLVAGHSLGSQIAYDAINKLNLLINEGEIKTYNTEAQSRLSSGKSICDQLKGFITFGCPLDKIAFFLRENVPDQQFIRQQILRNYHGFKQRDLDYQNNVNTNKAYVKADCGLRRYLEEVKWRNYFDEKDYVSGGLDYYTGLTNIDCRFKSKKVDFTHGNYWTSQDFYKDIIHQYLK